MGCICFKYIPHSTVVQGRQQMALEGLSEPRVHILPRTHLTQEETEARRLFAA